MKKIDVIWNIILIVLTPLTFLLSRILYKSQNKKWKAIYIWMIGLKILQPNKNGKTSFKKKWIKIKLIVKNINDLLVVKNGMT